MRRVAAGFALLGSLAMPGGAATAAQNPGTDTTVINHIGPDGKVTSITVPASPAATEPTIAGILSGQAAPLTMKLGALGQDWRRLTISGTSDLGLLFRGFGPVLVGSTAIYYTRGQTLTVGDQTYIVAYQPRRKSPSLLAQILLLSMTPWQDGGRPEPKAGEPHTADTVLSLSLLNLRTIGSIDDIRPFDLKEDIVENASPGLIENAMQSSREAAMQTTSLSNLKQLGFATLMYAQDWDEKLPPMKTSDAFKKAVMPYVKQETVFLTPDTQQPYEVNSSLNGKSEGNIARPADTVLLYEPAPRTVNGKLMRCVVFADGHAKAFEETRWPDMKKASGIQ